MLRLTIPEIELFDNEREEFVYLPERTIQLEHSLVSLSKWESKFHKPFISKEKRTGSELLEYIKCMTITQNIPSIVYDTLPKHIITKISDYIDSPMTATTFTNQNGSKQHSVVTAEIIYYWMITYNIPFECQKWHLNRLLTLINVCGIKNQSGKKMSRNDILSRNKQLNQQRLKKYNTRG